ncbi:DEAD/DEAH box helicase [Arvimicrobium flavum]|uniref:DEAD/DEAH box helicase n=1 Tax=Arvimicrobium flavum TaxID=3393320 RepID=UPI00237A689F|nr:DEAD/DEAH box helicase [Mesorhizobium shangrilense]
MTDFDTMAKPLAAALVARGYETLTPVQQAMLAPDVQQSDLLVSAQTGSGKTVAFGIAIAPTLLGTAERLGHAGLPLGLIVAPTRELAMQVKRELEWLYRETGARIGSCVGGMDMRSERRALADGAHIVVGTPGRLRDHITRGSLDMSEIRAIVLDEADEMLDLGFRDDLEFILAAAPEERRTLMFSATVPPQIAQLAKRFQRDAQRITVAGESAQHSDIEYQQILVAPADRENAIINTLLFFDSDNTIIFCHTREAVKHLAARLANRGFAVVALSGELSQAERTNALQSMRDGRARVCVATDVAARGIDLPNLGLVIHADLPTNPDTLLHRSGRTGRAGRKGICTLIVPYHRRGVAARVLRMARLTAATVPAPTAADIERHNHERILDDPGLSQAPGEDELALVGELMKMHSAENIAAAYLRLQLAARPAPEELLDAPAFPERGQREPRGERKERGDAAPRERSDFTDGVWFRVSVGRKHRADPKWLLPMICKAGHVTKRAVGSIKIQDAFTLFEIAGDKAEAFKAAIKENGTGEKGVSIQPADGKPPHGGEQRRAEEAQQTSWSPKKGKPKPDSAPKKPKTKPRWKKSKGA